MLAVLCREPTDSTIRRRKPGAIAFEVRTRRPLVID